jgi:hypothetical protein
MKRAARRRSVRAGVRFGYSDGLETATAAGLVQTENEIPRHIHELTTETSYVLDGDFINEGVSYPVGTEFNIKPKLLTVLIRRGMAVPSS